MNRRFAIIPLAVLAGMSLSGCVAVAIPALAGSAMAGSRVGDDGGQRATAPTPAPAAAPAPAPAIVTAPIPAMTAPVPVRDVDPAAAANPPIRIANPQTSIIAPPEIPRTAPVPAAPVSRAAAPLATRQPIQRPAAAYPDPANPLTPEQLGFARFVRYGQASAIGAKGGADLLSAVLSDPVALDGERRRCTAGEQPVAVIDLDPAGGVFAPPADPARQDGLALGLAVLREAGVVIAWLSDLSVNQSGGLRTALEQSGLDPRGEDIISLRRDGDDGKQQRMNNLAGITCIVAIAGDERADFDDRFKYLRSPEAGAGLEPVIGNGWFLIAPIFPTQGQ